MCTTLQPARVVQQQTKGKKPPLKKLTTGVHQQYVSVCVCVYKSNLKKKKRDTHII